MGETDVEIGVDNAISQTPTRIGRDNAHQSARSTFKVDSLLPFIERLRLDSVLAVFKDYYLPVFIGVFGIFSLEAAGVGNDQSVVANQLALLSFCSGNSVIFLNLSYESNSLLISRLSQSTSAKLFLHKPTYTYQPLSTNYTISLSNTRQ